MNRLLAGALFLLVFFFCFETLSFAQLRITPSLTVREEYNDNIYLTESNEEDDFITLVNPAINLSYKSRLVTLSLDYGLQFRLFADHSKENETSLSNTQRALLDTTINAYRDIFFIKVFDAYERIPVDYRRQVAFDNVLVNMTDSNRFMVNPYVEYPLAKTVKAKIGYTYENVWYKEEAGDNMENHTALVSLSKEWSPQIATSISYSYLIHRPEDTEKYDRNNIFFNVSYQMTPRLSLNGGVGQAWLDYERNKDFDSTIWNIQAQYLLSEFFTIGAAFYHDINDSVDSGAYETDRLSATLGYTGKIPVNLTVFHDDQDYLTIDRRDKSKGVTVDSTVPITSKMRGSIRGSYTHYDFNSIENIILVDPRFPFFAFLIPIAGKQDVDRYSVGLSLDYQLRITTVTLGYTFNNNDSSIDENDYNNNIVWLQAKFTL